MRRALLPPILLAAVACQRFERLATTTGPDCEAITELIQQVAATVNAGDVEGNLALYAEDWVDVPPDGRPLSGMETLRPLYEALFTGNTMKLTLQIEEVVVAGNLAVVRATYDETVRPKSDGEPVDVSGAWLAVLREQPDGSWTLWRTMYSRFPPPPAPAL